MTQTANEHVPLHVDWEQPAGWLLFKITHDFENNLVVCLVKKGLVCSPDWPWRGEAARYPLNTDF